MNDSEGKPQTSEVLPIHAAPKLGSPAHHQRSWVWHSSLSSREKGHWSVLAVFETIGAVALYWWLAIRYDTHWHLVSSVFVAPLLLLRSHASIETGLRWFFRDWLKVKGYQRWSATKTAVWLGILLGGGGVISSLGWAWLSQDWLGNQEGWHWNNSPVAMAILAPIIAMAIAVAISGAGTNSAAGSSAAAFAATSVAAVARMSVGPAKLLVILAVIIAILFLIIPFALGLTARALVFRVAATLRHLFLGFRQLPINWCENNFLVDSSFPAELIPGVRNVGRGFTFDGLFEGWSSTTNKIKWFLALPAAALFFVPTFLYRLNIKATAWFWWPLAYLLKPATLPVASSADAELEASQKEALCWPWTNPFQKLWIGISVLLVSISLILHRINPETWTALNHISALPLPLKVSLAIDWRYFEPWHWVQWVIAGCGIGMFWIGGTARSHVVNDNWALYRQSSLGRHFIFMTALQRVRRLATVLLLLMAAGALILQDQRWQDYLNLPERWVRALKIFYAINGQV